MERPAQEFPPERLQRLAELEGWHFWFAGRRAVVESLLRRHLRPSTLTVVDLGCGTGALVEELGRRGGRVVGLDRRPEGLLGLRARHPEALLVRGDAEGLPLREGTADLVILLDVLEHAEDAALLQEVQRVLAPGGMLLATVPAMPWLWSYRDEAAGHRRRYRRADLVARLSAARLAVAEVRYYQCLLFPLVAAARLLGRKSRRPRDLEERPLRPLNALLRWINALEARLGRFVRWPWGSSLAVVCTKS